MCHRRPDTDADTFADTDARPDAHADTHPVPRPAAQLLLHLRRAGRHPRRTVLLGLSKLPAGHAAAQRLCHDKFQRELSIRLFDKWS